jgi:phospholipid/cholesterol/gamma-HCH transport system substrate-binding protein
MLNRSSRTRRVRQVVVALVGATAVSLVCNSCETPQRTQYADYCAIMPDGVGLYVGNPVTQMGYQIGEVKSITPSLSSVRVDFTAMRSRRLPVDVRAVTRSPSILADRVLELVGNYASGPQLLSDGCIPLSRSSTPQSLSQIIGSTTKFVNAITPADSTNIGGVVADLDQALGNNGEKLNKLLTTSSSVLDSPDQGISDMRSIMTNLVDLTSTLRETTGPLKDSLLATYDTTADVTKAVLGGTMLNGSVNPLINMTSDMEAHLGDEFQTLYNDVEYAMRKTSAHAALFASLLKPIPLIANWFEIHANDKQFYAIRYRPPLYRVATSIDGLATCGQMNATSPGSCADVAGKPYAVDVALLQYVLTQAAHQ